MTSAITRVTLIFVPRQLNVYLRFGRPVELRVVDEQKRVAYFPPKTVFCRIWWQANEYGTTRWDLSVLRAAVPGEGALGIRGVAPGASVLLHVDKPNRVQLALRRIDAIEEQKIDPTEVAPTYWQTVHNRLAARTDAAVYTREQHAAYLCRRELV